MDNLEVQAASTLLGIGEADVDSALNSMPIAQGQREQVKKVAMTIIANQNRKGALSRSQRVLATKVGEFGEDLKAKVSRGKATVVDMSLYIAAKLGAAGSTTELLLNAPDASVGVTNLSNGKLPSGTGFLLTGIQVEFGANAANVAVDAIKYANVTADADSAFANGELEVLADGEQIVSKLPVSRCIATGEAGAVDAKGSRVYPLEAPKFFKPNASIDINHRSASGGAYAAAHNYIKVTLIGQAVK